MKHLLFSKFLGIPIALVLSIIIVSGAVFGAVYVLNKDIPATVTVISPPPIQYTLTVGVNDPVMGSATGGGTYDSGTVVTISANPNSGYHFTGWSGSVDDPSILTTTVTISSDMTVTANFADDEISVDLYTDLNCTQPFTGGIDFGSLLTTGVTKVYYFNANQSRLTGPSGYGGGQINPYSISITSPGIDESVVTFTGMVGEPFGAVTLPDGGHPCMITFSVTPVGAGTSSFTIHVTGTG